MKSDPAHRDALMRLACRQHTIACSDVAVCYRKEFDAIPIADRRLRMAVARAGGL